MASSTIGSTATNTIDHELRTITIISRGECNACISKLGEVMSPAGVGHGDEKSMVEPNTNANTQELNGNESKTNTTTRWIGGDNTFNRLFQHNSATNNLTRSSETSSTTQNSMREVHQLG